jgi:hypothetical protein
MIGVPFAHVGGVPIEEALGSLSPALLVGFGAAWAKLRARLRRSRSRANAHAPRIRRGRDAGRTGRRNPQIGELWIADAERERGRGRAAARCGVHAEPAGTRQAWGVGG